VRERDTKCVYCQVVMQESVHTGGSRRAVATWEHIINDASIVTPENIARCCASCNASKGIKPLRLWLRSSYCERMGITEQTVADIVRRALRRGA
jgi:5-methylcytosine-specific restriction endonuclease McrA